jgi:DNA sulfur modification protein DndB
VSNGPNREFAYTFPAIRGVQAGREFYVAMCPLRIVSKLFKAEEDDVSAELKAQRTLNRSRIPQLVRYVVDNPDSYVFSSLAASVDGELHFQPLGNDGPSRKLGTLNVPMEARFLINDGQHRLAAIEAALKESRTILNDSISIVLFADAGLARSQQMFADLNRYAVRPSKSLGILYDHRDPISRLTWHLVETVPVFKGMTETARSTISNRSRKLFTLSSIYQATRKLLDKREREPVTPEEQELVSEFWTEVAKWIPDWMSAVERKVNPSELRSDFIHAHGVALQAIATAGHALLATEPKSWRKRLARLKGIDWARSNAKLWEGRALIGGRLSKAEHNVVLTSNVLKRSLGLPLDPGEQKVEQFYETGGNRSPNPEQQGNANEGKARRAGDGSLNPRPRRRAAVGNRVQRG